MLWQLFSSWYRQLPDSGKRSRIPILDGSAKAYVENIQRVGIEEQNAVKDYYIIKSKIEFRERGNRIFHHCSSGRKFQCECTDLLSV